MSIQILDRYVLCATYASCLMQCLTCMLVRSFKIVKLLESYSPEAQPLGHHMRDMLPVYKHVTDVLRGKVAGLLAEDLQSGSVDHGDAQGLRRIMTV